VPPSDDDPTFASLERSPDAARAVPRSDVLAALCAGHFPGDPIVPGAYLLGVMAELAERLTDGPVHAVTRCLLMAPVRPGQAVVMTARRVPDGVEVVVDADGRTAARARVVVLGEHQP
jgi:3-hydroxymyristoyl/3-hydroxydecanoyl-(acyl carrier protein) dehydratase